MDYIDLLKLAYNFDKEKNFRLSDNIYKVVKAQTDDFDIEKDPLGISDIQPSRMKDDPVVVELTNKVMRGEISEQQFWIMLEKYKPGSFQNMLQNIGKPHDTDVDKIVGNISSQGVKVDPKERDILAKFYEISDEVFVNFMQSLESNFASALRTMSRNNILPEIFQDVDEYKAGNLIMELLEPSTKEEMLTREYLELRAKDITLEDAIEIGTNGEFSDINEYLKSFVDSQVPAITAKASRITGLQYQEDDVARKLSDVTMNTLNETIDNSLTELYYIYKG
jgi:hypothetical protein